MKKLLLASLLLGACATDDDTPPAPPPTCAEIMAPSTVLCNSGGLCDYNGQECCNPVHPGVPHDPVCEGLF